MNLFIPDYPFLPWKEHYITGPVFSGIPFLQRRQSSPRYRLLLPPCRWQSLDSGRVSATPYKAPAGRRFYIGDVGIDSGVESVGIGGKGKRSVGKGKDRPAVNGPVAVLVPARRSASGPSPCRPRLPCSSIPDSCAQASLRERVFSGHIRLSLKVYNGGWQRRRLRDMIFLAKKNRGIFWVIFPDVDSVIAGIQ